MYKLYTICTYIYWLSVALKAQPQADTFKCAHSFVGLIILVISIILQSVPIKSAQISTSLHFHIFIDKLPPTIVTVNGTVGHQAMGHATKYSCAFEQLCKRNN